ncbi:hypothetical protein QBC34DRAFT_467965 [Podospora aff. communis PSN243]|uniref:Uncharacterized protein n=1 Tax=Podospora aff. communis PSN243 TaxID=3040156 RepID=A0AAV9H0E6_9PEZI|nr:hypothetical protein QBC34DRAFT_467965 [Podospora aff. communis PSN243]
MNLLIILTLNFLTLSHALPSTSPQPNPLPELNSPCGPDIGDCPGTLTCIPLSQNCTVWRIDEYSGRPPCRGTCQDIDIARQKVYTLCGGWRRMDDCNEAVEQCVADPRHDGACGPACDGPGICLPKGDVCGWDTGRTCGEGRECFFGGEDVWPNGVPGSRKGCQEWEAEDGTWVKQCQGQCLPLRFGSDTYEKTGREEIITDRWDGWQESEE